MNILKQFKIITREFKKASGAKQVLVQIDLENERIEVTADGKKFVMEIGSDDDCFTFVRGKQVISFDFPKDWK